MKYKLRKDPGVVLQMIEAGVRRCAGYTDNVEFSAEDASRSERDFLCRVVETAIKAGATTINLPDTVGYAQPQEFADLIRYVIENTPNSDKAIFSVHCHNDLGLAVANTLAALSVGARQAEVTISGIGERAGNAALEELAMALRVRKDCYGLEHGIVTEQLYPSCRLLSMTIGQPIPNNKAIVGANAFAHESGIHQDGMLKNRETYEIMTPQSVGRNESNPAVMPCATSSRAWATAWMTTSCRSSSRPSRPWPTARRPCTTMTSWPWCRKKSTACPTCTACAM